MLTKSKTDWSYLAALFDGEGSFSISRTKGIRQSGNLCGKPYDNIGMRIQITNTDLRLHEWLVKHFGGKYYHQKHANISPNHKLAYNWRPSGRANEEYLLLGIIPYLVLKTRQAEICLEFIRLNPLNKIKYDESLWQRRIMLMNELQNLNKRGTLLTTNTLDTSSKYGVKIESELYSDVESEPGVIQVPFVA